MDTPLSLLIVQSLVVSGITWVAWKLFQHKILPSPLDNIPGPPSQSLLLGNVRQWFARDAWEFHMHLAQDYQSVVRLHSLLGAPWLYVSDEKALHTILIKEGHIFDEPDLILKTNANVFGPGLLATTGDMHRKQRKILNSVFSVAHMRYMLPIFLRVGNSLRDAIAMQVESGPREQDIVNWMGRVSLELIGQGCLGRSFDPLISEPKDGGLYAHTLKSLFPLIAETGPLWNFSHHVDWIGSSSFRRWVVAHFPVPAVRKLGDVVDFMHERSAEIFATQKAITRKGDAAASLQQSERKDVMSVLLKANAAAAEEDRMSEEELVSQITTLVFAGVDTTSNALCRIFWLLSEHQDVQDRLREEVREMYAAAGEMTYDRLTQLPLLDAVCRETIRLYPPVVLPGRVANNDTIIPLARPMRGKDGSMIMEIPVRAGTQIAIGVFGTNTSKALWGEDALEWKPDRWLKSMPDALNEANVPGVFSKLMSFLGGKRACIGFKFSEMEMKAILSILVSNFKFERTEKNIVWNISPVVYPSVEVQSPDAKMPLRVSLTPGAKVGP